MLERRDIGICDGDVSGLHWDEFLVGFEVVVVGEDPCGHEFLGEDLDEVEQVLRVVVANVVDLVGWDWQAVVAGFLLWGFGHYKGDAFDDVVHVCEVAFAVAVVEDLYRVAFDEFVGEGEVCHVRSSCGAVDGEEPEPSGWDVVEL